MFKNEFTEKGIYNIVIITFVIIGILYTTVDRVIPYRYTFIACFCLFKIIFNYRKCTISRLECKIRKVKREDGILSSFLDHVVDLRNSKIKYFLYILTVIFILHTDKIKEFNNCSSFKDFLKSFF